MEDNMSALDNTPINHNFLSPLNFKFQIKKAPHVNFFIQKVNIPGLSITNLNSPNPFVRIPYPGEHISYEDLTISFKVDEDLNNYLELHRWLTSLGKPENYDQYKNIEQFESYTGDGIVSDISLIVLASTKMPNFEIVFLDAFPVNLTGISFNSNDSDVNYLQASATFKYNLYTINKII
jgi:hypothetical protein